jgi:hypothetical protein
MIKLKVQPQIFFHKIVQGKGPSSSIKEWGAQVSQWGEKEVMFTIIRTLQGYHSQHSLLWGKLLEL